MNGANGAIHNNGKQVNPIERAVNVLYYSCQRLYSVILNFIYTIVTVTFREYKKKLELFAVFIWMFLMPLSAFFQLVTVLCPLLWPYWIWIQIDKAPERGGRVSMLMRRVCMPS